MIEYNLKLIEPNITPNTTQLFFINTTVGPERRIFDMNQRQKALSLTSFQGVEICMIFFS